MGDIHQPRFRDYSGIWLVWTCVCMKLLQSCPTLWNTMDCSPQGSSVHGILQAKNTRVGCQALLQVIFPTQGLNPGLSGSLPLEPPGKPWYEHTAAAAAAAKSFQSCLTLCDPIDSSPPGSPIPGILQARTLEWVAISFSNAWKWELKVKSLSRVDSATPWTAAYQAPPPMGFSGKSTGVGCHCLLQVWTWEGVKTFKACKANRWVRQDLPHSTCLLSDMLRCTGVTASL